KGGERVAMEGKRLRGSALEAERLAEPRPGFDRLAAVLPVDLLDLRDHLALERLGLREPALHSDLHGAIAADLPRERVLLAEHLAEEGLDLQHLLLRLRVMPAPGGDERQPVLALP